MSPRNITTCPQCEKRHKLRFEKWLASYGKCSAEQFFSSRVEKDFEPETLKEYYDFTIHLDGSLLVNYNCICEVCGFSLKERLSNEET